MILRFKLYSIACGATLLSTSGVGAFTIPAQKGSASSRIATTAALASLNPDWDNADFLSSLGGSQEEMDAANEKYYKQSDNRQAMNEWKMKQMEKSGKGPSMEFLKKMGLKDGEVPAEPDRATSPPPPRQQMQQPPQPQMPPPQMQVPPQMQQPAAAVPTQQQFFDANGNPITMPMVYDANGNPIPFNPAMQQQPAAQAAQPQMPPQINPGPDFTIVEPPLPPKTKGTDTPRPVGYNPDAFTMSNTADVYLAQLKQDTKVRKIARMSGDLDTANTVFGDESVIKIKDSWNENPYTKEKNYAEARAEIEGTVRLQVMGDDDAPDKLSSGISYKQKLEQSKAKRAGGGTIGQQQQPKVEEAPPKMEQPKVAMPAPTQVIPKTVPPPPKVGQPIPTNVVPVSQSPPAAVAVPPPATAAAAGEASSGPADEEDVRRKVRTLQGLLLKHRGGPGFGSGRLKAPEAKRLEDTLEEVLSILKTEGGGGGGAPAEAAPVVESKPVASVPPPPVAKTMPPPPQKTTPPPPAVPKPAAPVQASAPPMTTSQPAVDPLAGSVACVEAALKMYKDSSPAEREIMMVPLREALMAAVNGCNKFIAEDELAEHKATMEAGPSTAFPASPVTTAAPAYGGRETHMYGNFGSEKEEAAAPKTTSAAPSMQFPSSYAVTKPEQDAPAAPIASATTHFDNEKKLEEVYNALMEASGTGKLGLKNMSGDQANELADKLQTMRTVLLDEMNDGK